MLYGMWWETARLTFQVENLNLFKIGEEIMKEVLNRIFQVLMDVLVGMAIYYGVNAFFPSLSNNLVIVATLVVTAVFAEFVEIRFKK